MRRALCAGLLALGLAAAGSAGAAECRLALALALDVSGSVDDREYRLQLDGLATALERPEVVEALLAVPAADVELTVFVWSGPGFQRLVLPWRRLRDRAAIAAAAARLRATGRAGGPPSTAVGEAMRRGAALLGERGGCWRRVLDVSGDGESNTGTRPQVVRQEPAFADVVVNALVVGPASGRVGRGAADAVVDQLSDYFRAQVIHGPGAFVETARGYGDYADAMARKLMREIEVMAVGRLDQ